MARPRLLMRGMSSISSLASFAAATLDLNLVRSIRAAISGADQAVANQTLGGQVSLPSTQLTPLAGIALGNNPSPETIAAVLPAALDLQLVELIRSAMEVADLVVASEAPLPSMTPPPQPDIQTVVEVQKHIQLAPVIEPGKVIQLAPTIQPAPAQQPPPPLTPSSLPPASAQSHPHRDDLYPQPPWKFLPWPQHESSRAPVKRVVAVPDILIKGLLIDLFM
jgi:hypothetical protein